MTKEEEKKKKRAEQQRNYRAKKKAEKEAEEKAVVETPPEPSIDEQMDDMNKQGEVDLNNALIQQAIANFVAEQTGNIKQEKIVRKGRCHRHPEVTLKPHENCQKCIQQTNLFNARTEAAKFVLPCPRCGRKTRSEDGGCIQTFYSKKGCYACAVCEIDYSTSGEAVEWKSGKSQGAVNREIDFRTKRAK